MFTLFSYKSLCRWSVICLFAFAWLVPAADEGEAAAGPLLQITPEVVQLGMLDTSDGQRFFPATFTLRNSGTAPLVLGSLRTSCGCTRAKLAKRELSPGESTHLEVSIDITGRYGKQRFHVFVNSNAPGSPQRISVEAIIPDTRTGWSLMPPIVTFREAAKPVRVNVRLFDQLENVQVTAVELPEGCRLLTKLPVSIPVAGIAGLEVDCTPEALRSGGRHPFIVYATHPEIPQQKGTVNLVPNPQAPSQATTKPAVPSQATAKPAAPSQATATPATDAASATPAPAPPSAQVVPIQVSVLRELLSTASELSNVLVLDVRTAQDFADGHVPRSHSYPASRWADKPFWPDTSLLVLVADDDVKAEQAADALLKTDCRHILLLQGGFPAWKNNIHTILRYLVNNCKRDEMLSEHFFLVGARAAFLGGAADSGCALQ